MAMLHAMCDVPWMRDVAFALIDLYLVDLTAAGKRQEAASCDVGIAPVGEAQFCVVLWFQGEGVAGPGQQSLALADDPVLAAIEVDRDDARDGRLGRDEGGDGAGGRDFLVEKGNADGGASDGFEDGESGDGILGLPTEGDKGAAAGVERLRGGEGDGEEGEGGAEDVEAGVWSNQRAVMFSSSSLSLSYAVFCADLPGDAVGMEALSRLVCGSSAGSVAEAVAAMLIPRAAIGRGRTVTMRVQRATAVQGEAAGRSMVVAGNWRAIGRPRLDSSRICPRIT